MRQQAKDLIFRAYAAGKRLKGGDERIAVLCYHRVSDEMRDNVTVGVDQFDQQIAHLKTNYTLVSLRDLIDGNLPEKPHGPQPASRSQPSHGSQSSHDPRPSHGSQPSHGPVVAVTFDDGYLDNYENAFPILDKHGVGATFFVSTDHITEDKPFAHDLDKLGRELPNMSWDQIREMHRAGMDFGSHTANHVDLGQTDQASAWKELVRSDAAVKKELGIQENLFAFPFGRPQNMTEANHALIKKAGYHCCCSAHGGLNECSALDRFDVKRIGVNYGFSLPALDAYMAGWRHSHANAT